MNILAQSTTTTFNYRDILLDLRGEIFLRMILIVGGFSSFGAYLTLLEKPFPSHLFFLLSAQCLAVYTMYRLSKRHANLARYLLIILLHIFLLTGMVIVHKDWVVLLSIPLLLMSGLLVSNSSILSASFIVITTMLLTKIGFINFPLEVLYLILCLMAALTLTTISTFYVALSWYSSMHRRADELLHEARNRRAELLNTLKSLDMAYTTQQRMHQQLVYARQQANEARRLKERFAANISHELRTPLNLILGFSEIMYLTPEVYGDVHFTPKLVRDIYQIFRNSKHLLGLIDDILDLSHIEMSGFTLNFEPTNMNDFMAEAVDIMQNLFRDSQVMLIIDIEDNLPIMEIDRTRVRQILLNLLSNAQRFTEEGSVTISAGQLGRDLVIRVSDTGKGIAEDQIQHIFDEFYQVDYSLSRSHGGAGLGLAITKRFVEAHEGMIMVQSEFGVGTIFTVNLPLSTSRQRLVKAMTTHEPDIQRNKQPIVVIDPDPSVATLINRFLTEYSVIPIDTPLELDQTVRQYSPVAIVYNNRRQMDDNTIDFEADIPVIECSLPSTLWLVEQLGVLACLPKPVTTAQLSLHIQKLRHIGKILVVDDDLGFVQLVQRSIETLPQPYRILRAYDGLQALEVIEQQRPDLILLDIAMPEMNGFEVIDRLRENPNTATIPIILLTATRYVESDFEQNTALTVRKSGGLNPNEVLRTLQAILDKLLAY